MSKRFPIPEFNRAEFKNRDWMPPALLDAAARDKFAAAHAVGDPSAVGCRAVQVSQGFCERFLLRGEHVHALMCALPAGGAHLLGHSYAWYIQRALLVTDLDPAKAQVLYDWTTPRPMNTRLGPDNGVDLAGGIVYALTARRYADHWIVNRTLVEGKPGEPGGNGFRILSATDDLNNDFHACNLSFNWA